jgi:hypothetical protein
MPVKSISRSPDPGHLIQVCAGCGAGHRISLDRGAQKAKTGPVVLQVGDTLEVRVDARPPKTVTFAAGDFPDFARVTAAQLAAKLPHALPGVIASDDAGGLLLESATTGPESRVEITGGSARAALGFPTNGAVDPCPGRPILGISFGPESMQDPNVLALRRCNDCGSNECLVRTFDATTPELDGTHFKEHRKAVNTLAEHCKARGWSHPDVAAHHAAEVARPLDVHAAFPDRWELSQVVQRTASTAAMREPR